MAGEKNGLLGQQHWTDCARQAEWNEQQKYVVHPRQL